MTRSGAVSALRSVLPSATDEAIFGRSISTYCTSVNPSPRSNSSATYIGARQIAGTLAIRIRVVSGGGSALSGWGFAPISPIAVAAAKVPAKSRRLSMPIRVLLLSVSVVRVVVTTRDPNNQSWSLRESECEGRTLADLARHPDLAAVQLDKLPRQRKPEPGALAP